MSPSHTKLSTQYCWLQNLLNMREKELQKAHLRMMDLEQRLKKMPDSTTMLGSSATRTKSLATSTKRALHPAGSKAAGVASGDALAASMNQLQLGPGGSNYPASMALPGAGSGTGDAVLTPPSASTASKQHLAAKGTSSTSASKSYSSTSSALRGYSSRYMNKLGANSASVDSRQGKPISPPQSTQDLAQDASYEPSYPTEPQPQHHLDHQYETVQLEGSAITRQGASVSSSFSAQTSPPALAAAAHLVSDADMCAEQPRPLPNVFETSRHGYTYPQGLDSDTSSDDSDYY